MVDFLLVEDDCSPDSTEYFDKALQEQHEVSIKDFKEKGDRIEFGYILADKGLKIEYFPDAPYWHLSKMFS